MIEERYCYKVSIDLDFGKIKKCQIVKETKRTYVIQEMLNPFAKQTIRKSGMTAWDGYICLGFEEAKDTRIELIKTRIETNKKKIEFLDAQNKELENDLLKEIVE